jgi:hypothetical protein
MTKLSPRARLILEVWWFLLSLGMSAIGWINYINGNGHWYLVLAIFGVMFFLYSIGSAIYYWRFYQRKS